MKPEQEQHLERVKREFDRLIDVKYRKGAKEHQTILHELPTMWLLNQAIDEALDQVTYLLTLKEALKREDREILEDK